MGISADTILDQQTRSNLRILIGKLLTQLAQISKLFLVMRQQLVEHGSVFPFYLVFLCIELQHRVENNHFPCGLDM